MTYSFQNPSQEQIFSYLKESHVIAVVGLSDRKETAAYQVAAYMQAAGYRIIPVNPKLEGKTLLGERVYASIKNIPERVDIVNVFRRSEFLADVAREFLETDVAIYWAQLGLESQEAEAILRSADREAIVMNKCIKIEHTKMNEKS